MPSALKAFLLAYCVPPEGSLLLENKGNADKCSTSVNLLVEVIYFLSLFYPYGLLIFKPLFKNVRKSLISGLFQTWNSILLNASLPPSHKVPRCPAEREQLLNMNPAGCGGIHMYCQHSGKLRQVDHKLESSLGNLVTLWVLVSK